MSEYVEHQFKSASEVQAERTTTPFHAEIEQHNSPSVKAGRQDLAIVPSVGNEPDFNQVFEKFKTFATPQRIEFASGIGVLNGIGLAEKKFGKGPEIFSQKIGGVNITAHETAMTALKYMAVPVATAAAYSFYRDFESLKHSTSPHDTFKDAAAMVADTVTIAGAGSAFVPKVRLFSTAIQIAGTSTRAVLGDLNK